jgi:hypothetical protein
VICFLFGRTIVPSKSGSSNWRPSIGFVVWMLVVRTADLVAHLGITGIGRTITRHLQQPGIPRNATLVAVLVFWWSQVGIIQRPYKNANIVTIGVVEGQRRTACSAEPAPSDVGTHEIADRATRDPKFWFKNGTDDRVWTADSFLAHSAVANMNILRLLIEGIAHRTTLASPDKTNITHRPHLSVVVLRSSGSSRNR